MQIHFSLLLFPPTVFPRQLSSVSLALLRLTRISVQLHPPPSPPPPSTVASSHRRRNRDKISPHKCEPCKGFGWIFSLFFFLYPGSSVRSFIGKSEYSRHPVCTQHNASLPLLFIRIKWAITKNPEVCVVSPSLPLSLSLFSGNKKREKDSVSLPPVSQKAPSGSSLGGGVCGSVCSRRKGTAGLSARRGRSRSFPEHKKQFLSSPFPETNKTPPPPLKKTKTQTPNKTEKDTKAPGGVGESCRQPRAPVPPPAGPGSRLSK